MKPISLEPSELILQIEKERQDMYFLSDGRKYEKIGLSGTEEEEYYVLDDPISETLRPWVEISVLDNVIEKQRSFDISCKWYGLTPKEEEAITNMIDQVHLALNTGTSLSINLNSIFNLSDWVLTLE